MPKIRIGILFALLIYLLLGLSAPLAQSVPGRRVIPLGVYDKQDQLIQGVTPERIRVKKVRGTVRQVELDSSPRRIILLLDMSGSMGQDKKWAHAIALTKEFLSVAQADDWISLHLFAEKHEVAAPFTHDFDSIGKELDTLPEPRSKANKQTRGYRTLLGNALASILNTEEELRMGDAIVLVSDGEAVFESQAMKPKELKTRVLRAGLRVFLVTVEKPGNNLSLAFVTGAPLVYGLAWESGGGTLTPWETRAQIFFSVPPENISKVSRAAYGLVRNVYRVELEISEPIKKLRKLELEVLDERGKRIPYEQVAYPRYLAPSPPER